MDAKLSTDIAVAQSDVRRFERAAARAQLDLGEAQRHLEALLRQAGPGVYEQKSDGRSLLNG
jgi:hypothetical protein